MLFIKIDNERIIDARSKRLKFFMFDYMFELTTTLNFKQLRKTRPLFEKLDFFVVVVG